MQILPTIFMYIPERADFFKLSEEMSMYVHTRPDYGQCGSGFFGNMINLKADEIL